jgi:4-nitrophenyl phosphatase
MGLANAPRDSRLTYVFDLDGVIYRGTEPQPHAQQLVQSLRDQGHYVRFFTNNSAATREDYVRKLTGMGIPVTIDEIMTSSYATALYFKERGALGKTVYRIGEQGMEDELTAGGMRVIYDQDEPDAKIDFVVVGLDRDFHYRKLARAMSAILNGAEFIATNCDATFPVESGELLPGGGSIASAVAVAVGRDPYVIGKPETYAMQKILDQTGSRPDEAIVVGDRLDTDIEAGNRIGACTVLVLTGVTSREQAEAAEGDMEPDVIIDTLAELAE